MNIRPLLLISLFASACGPTGRPGIGGGDDNPGGPDSSLSGPEVCTDGVDNDGDGRTDCSDIDCSGRDGCPVCGQVQVPESQPLALPDGVSSGSSCSSDSQCTTAAAPNCVFKECHGSYTSTLNFVGFPQGSTLVDPTLLKRVCVNMEHSWLRDLQIELLTPSGGVFILDKFADRTGGEIYLGQANDSDDAANPVPGTGYQYCWTSSAANTMLTAPTMTIGSSFDTHQVLPAGDYASDSPWNILQGTQLNGEWTLRVTDLWGIDNGYVFSWSIEFDPSLVSDCAGPIIL